MKKLPLFSITGTVLHAKLYIFVDKKVGKQVVSVIIVANTEWMDVKISATEPACDVWFFLNICEEWEDPKWFASGSDSHSINTHCLYAGHFEIACLNLCKSTFGCYVDDYFFSTSEP